MLIPTAALGIAGLACFPAVAQNQSATPIMESARATLEVQNRQIEEAFLAEAGQIKNIYCNSLPQAVQARCQKIEIEVSDYDTLGEACPDGMGGFFPACTLTFFDDQDDPKVVIKLDTQFQQNRLPPKLSLGSVVHELGHAVAERSVIQHTGKSPTDNYTDFYIGFYIQRVYDQEKNDEIEIQVPILNRFDELYANFLEYQFSKTGLVEFKSPVDRATLEKYAEIEAVFSDLGYTLDEVYQYYLGIAAESQKEDITDLLHRIGSHYNGVEPDVEHNHENDPQLETGLAILKIAETKILDPQKVPK